MKFNFSHLGEAPLAKGRRGRVLCLAPFSSPSDTPAHPAEASAWAAPVCTTHPVEASVVPVPVVPIVGRWCIDHPPDVVDGRWRGVDDALGDHDGFAIAAVTIPDIVVANIVVAPGECGRGG